MLGLLVLATACGDWVTESPRTTANGAPQASGALPNQTITLGEWSRSTSRPFLRDPDGDVLTHADATPNASVASVWVSGSVVTVTGVAQGTATVTDSGEQYTVGEAVNAILPSASRE